MALGAPRSLKSRALQLLAQRDQSKVELRRKLLVHARAANAANGASGDGRAHEAVVGAASGAPTAAGAPHGDAPAASLAAEVDAVLAWLESNGFLSLERFAESRVNARLQRFGNLRIRQELARHEVVLGDEAMQALTVSELDRARAVHARKFPQAPASPTEAARQARFLGARGFSSDVVRRVLREAGRASFDDR